ncbi:unnamed protein product [Rotaria sordida]|uniref:Uncharacterized protein n=1 Tax=Rotaria sordida TaxID=392033 RepID=A0A814ARU2_9BILA|nr:unnamed protein product [Rotaria sordida]CAF0901886.1 unnamed protein product [Rotaria sordida]CAF0906866.1 unnamed protein product [Rotaria sordida]CAF0917532.1 unnamed protein product [Rotaria sordida]CAF0924502.1 unnamed protein product [Rotaria sordida]
MVILTGYQEAVNKLANAEVAFVGRLTSVTPSLSICSTPPVNHYTLKFENELRPLKGSIATIYEFHYEQKMSEEQILNISDTLDITHNRKAPQPGQLYVAILHADNNTIETLIAIEEHDVPLLQTSTK